MPAAGASAGFNIWFPSGQALSRPAAGRSGHHECAFAAILLIKRRDRRPRLIFYRLRPSLNAPVITIPGAEARFTSAAPTSPPIRACELLDGIPAHEVNRAFRGDLTNSMFETIVERRLRYCGLRRSSFSSAYSIRPAWRQRVASYRLRRSSAKLGRLASRRKQRANSTVVASAFIPVGKRFYVADSQAR